jgi:hypothetical protein
LQEVWSRIPKQQSFHERMARAVDVLPQNRELMTYEAGLKDTSE